MNFLDRCSQFASAEPLINTNGGTQERVLYNKEIQTSSFVETGPSPDYEAELRQRITREREVEEAERLSQEDALEAESVKLDHEIEREIRGAFRNAA